MRQVYKIAPSSGRKLRFANGYFDNNIDGIYDQENTFDYDGNERVVLEKYMFDEDGDRIHDEGGWVFFSKKTATEFDDKGRPVVIMDSSQWIDKMTVGCRIVHTYTESGLYSSTTEFRPAAQTEPVEEWEPRERRIHLQ